MSDIDVDKILELAEFIRTVNGNNRMGAAKLAEVILEWQARRAHGGEVEPEGWKLVPIVPTENMAKAAFDAFEVVKPMQYRNGTEARNAVYEAMLAAAPSAQNHPSGEWVPDMFWNRDDNDMLGGIDEWELADFVAQDMIEGESRTIQVQCAKRLPDRWMNFSVDDEGEAHWVYVSEPKAQEQGDE